MNLEQFTATRRESFDIGKDIGSPENFVDANGNEYVATGFIYDGDCYIESIANGAFYLVIHNQEWTADNIAELERELHQWCVDECLF